MCSLNCGYLGHFIMLMHSFYLTLLFNHLGQLPLEVHFSIYGHLELQHFNNGPFDITQRLHIVSLGIILLNGPATF